MKIFGWLRRDRKQVEHRTRGKDLKPRRRRGFKCGCPDTLDNVIVFKSGNRTCRKHYIERNQKARAKRAAARAKTERLDEAIERIFDEGKYPTLDIRRGS